MTDKKILEDMVRVAGSAFGTMTGLKGEIEVFIRQKMESCLARMQLVTREEFDVLKEMLAKSRMEQEKLATRLAALEQRVAAQEESNV